jgi:hypothetical protein
MGARRVVRVAASVATGLLAFLYYPDKLRSTLGIAPAEAKSFYTRKRVDGKWITGRFVKRHTTPTRQAARSDRRAEAARTEQSIPSTPPTPPRPEDQRSPDVNIGSAALPDALALRAGLETPAASDERLVRLQEALRARASKLAEGDEQRPATTGAIGRTRVPRSVGFDFDKGVKTTSFSDGTKVEESFDASVEQRVPPLGR